jgi:tripartite-type tricarboxylate transporter receptor subunit TctC
LAVGLVVAAGGAASASDVEDFYKGRQLSVIVGSDAGAGGYDGYARLIARHIIRFLPGNPTSVVRNMPAASGLAAANYLYAQAPRDGSTFAMVHNNMTVEPVIGNAQAKFEPAKFNWIGSANKLVNVCVAWHTVPVRTIEDLRSKEWITGGTAARSSTVQQANTFIVLGGAKLKVVQGYPSTTSMILALQRGEIQIACGIGWDSVKLSTGFLQTGEIVPVMQLGYKPHPELKSVPFIYDMLLDPGMKDVLDFITIRLDVGRAYAAPPDVPAERVAALREAFWKAIHDPALKAEANKQLMEIQPQRGEDIQKSIEKLVSTPKNIIALTDKVLENDMKAEQAKLNWIEVKGAKLTGIEDDGGTIAFADGGKPVKAGTAGAKISIAGQASKRGDLKQGLDCDISYLGNGDLARTIACR